MTTRCTNPECQHAIRRRGAGLVRCPKCGRFVVDPETRDDVESVAPIPEPARLPPDKVTSGRTALKRMARAAVVPLGEQPRPWVYDAAQYVREWDDPHRPEDQDAPRHSPVVVKGVVVATAAEVRELAEHGEAFSAVVQEIGEQSEGGYVDPRVLIDGMRALLGGRFSLAAAVKAMEEKL